MTLRMRPSQNSIAKFELLEPRHLLTTIGFDAVSEQLTFTADVDEADIVDVSAPNASTLQIQVGNGDAIVLQGDAAGNPDFQLSQNVVPDDTLQINIANVNIDEFFATLGNLNDSFTVTGIVGVNSLTINGGTEDDSIDATNAMIDVHLDGGAGNDILTGGSGNDVLAGGGGTDVLDGGSGNDTNSFSTIGVGVVANLGSGTASYQPAPGVTVFERFSNFENLEGSDFDDQLFGDGNENTLSGGDGNDLLIGSGGNDILNGNEGNDVLRGGGGSDTQDGGNGIDTLDFRDINQGAADPAASGVTADLGAGTASYLAPGGNLVQETFSNFENLTGSENNDFLTGDNNANVIAGGAGDDRIEGLGGDDTLRGDALGLGEAITITVENLLPAGGTFATPVWFGIHDGSFDLFDVGQAASQGLERIAEDGSVTGLAAEFNQQVGANGIDATIFGGLGVPGIIDPGETSTFTLAVDPNQVGEGFFTFATMVIPSNDAFLGGADNPLLNPLFDANGNFIGPIVIERTGADVLDAGTEVNTETEAAFLNQTGPDSGTEENGVVALHPGFNGSVGNPGGAPVNVLGGTTAAGTIIDPVIGDFTADNDVIFRITIDRAGGGNDLIIGGAGNDQIDGSVGDDVLRGSVGDDNIAGGDGDDNLNGGAGNDELLGQGGNDLLLGIGGTDSIDGGAGNDTNSFQGIGLAVTATVDANGVGTASYGAVSESFVGIENLNGSQNDDTLIATGNAENIIRGLDGNDTIVGGGGDDRLIGNSGDDLIRGNSGNDVVNGGGGSDNLQGGAGNDRLIGGDGDDLLNGGSGTDRITGGDGQDTNSFAGLEIGVSATLNAGGNGTATYGTVLEAFTGVEVLSGSDNADVFIANGNIDAIFRGRGGDDILVGGLGNDVLVGGLGNDTLRGNGGNDSIFGNEGADILAGGAGNDFLTGLEGNDSIFGNLGDDSLFGGDDDDLLVGGAGVDQLDGGSGNNREFQD